MKMKHYIYKLGLLLALSSLLAGCSMHIAPNGDDHTGDLKMRNLYLNIQKDNMLKHKGLQNGDNDDNEASGTVVKFSNGILVAVDVNNYITVCYKLTTSNTPGKGEFSINDLINKTKPVPVPAESKHIYIWGNLVDRNGTPKNRINLDQFKRMNPFPIDNMPSITIPDESLSEDDAKKDPDETTTSNAIIYGESPITQQEDNDFLADMALVPLISRIEIKQIQGIDLKSFNVSGIYMDSLIMELPINGNPTLTNHRIPDANILQSENKGEDESAKYFTPNDPKFVYDKNGYDKLANYDTSIGTLIGNIVKTKRPNKVWSYNIFSGYLYQHVGSTDSKPTYADPIMDPPHIVLNITDAIQSSSLNESQSGYVVLKTYKKEGESTPITAFEPGHIYKIPSIDFKYSNIWPDPSPHHSIEVQVSVNVMEWTVDTQDIDI